MVIASDIILKGTVWKKAAETFSPIFKERLHYDVFLLSTSIGVAYDKRKETLDDNSGADISIPRNVFNGRSDPFDTLFQSAILTTTTEELEDEARLKIAFAADDETDGFNRIQFLTQFANFGVEKLLELDGLDDIDSMEKLLNFVIATAEGHNFEITDLDDDAIAEALDQ